MLQANAILLLDINHAGPLMSLRHRYDSNKQELISEEIGVAYPIIDGIPRLVPTAGRVMDAADTPNLT